MHQDPNDSVKAMLLQPAQRWAEVIVGVASAVFGGLLSLASLNLAIDAFSNGGHIRLAAYLVIFMIAAIATLLLTCGIRLLEGRSPERRSLLAPTIWYGLSGCFLVLAAFVTYGIVKHGLTAAAGQALVSALLFALLAFGAGSHFARASPRRRNRGAA